MHKAPAQELPLHMGRGGPTRKRSKRAGPPWSVPTSPPSSPPPHASPPPSRPAPPTTPTATAPAPPTPSAAAPPPPHRPASPAPPADADHAVRRPAAHQTAAAPGTTPSRGPRPNLGTPTMLRTTLRLTAIGLIVLALGFGGGAAGAYLMLDDTTWTDTRPARPTATASTAPTPAAPTAPADPTARWRLGSCLTENLQATTCEPGTWHIV